MKQRSALVRDMLIAVSSSGAPFLLAIVCTPIMTRLYAPETYGVFGIFNSTAVVAVGVGLFSLPNVVPLEKDERVRQDISDTMITLVATLVLLALLAFLGSSVAAVYVPGMRSYLAPLAILPLLIALSGARQIVDSFAIAYGAFTAMSFGRAVHWQRHQLSTTSSSISPRTNPLISTEGSSRRTYSISCSDSSPWPRSISSGERYSRSHLAKIGRNPEPSPPISQRLRS